MPMADATTVTVREETWERLAALKSRGDSFDDVISGLLDETEAADE